MSGKKFLISMMIVWTLWALASSALSPCVQAAESETLTPAERLEHEQHEEDRRGVRVPDIRGRHVTEAEAMILRAGLSPGPMTLEDSDAPEGTVLRQVPAAGQQVRPGTPVRLWLARPPAAPRVPSVIGHPVREAERILQEADLRLREGGREHSDQPEGTVIRQEPGPGGVRPPDAVVTVWLAMPELVTVPNLVGESVENATYRLGRTLRLGQQSMQPSESAEGLILEQTPPAGAKLPLGGTVDVVVGTGGLVRVPRVVGENQMDAVGQLDVLDLRVGRVVTEESRERSGTVIRQQPAGGGLTPRGSAVNIWVAVRAADGKRPRLLWPWLIGIAAALLAAVARWWSHRPEKVSETELASEPKVRVHIGAVESRTMQPLPVDPQIPEIGIRVRLLRDNIEITTEPIVVREERRET